MRTTSSKFKENFDRFPIEARQSIERAVNKNIEPIRQAIGSQNQALQEEILTLKDHLVKANADRLHNQNQLNALQDKIRNHKTLEEVKRKELEMLMFDKVNRYHGGDRGRTEIPDLPPKPFALPQMPKNYEIRLKNKMANKVMMEPAQLYSKNAMIKVPRGGAANADNFDDERVLDTLNDRDKCKYAEFYTVHNQGIKIQAPFPDLEDDHLNRQGIVLPRFRQDMMDEDRHIIDIYNNNEDRLKALSDKSERSALTNMRAKEKIDFEKVDRIIDALDAFKDKYFDDRQMDRVTKEFEFAESPNT